MQTKDIICNAQEFQDFCDKIKNGYGAKSILLFCKDDFYSFEFAKMLASAILNNGEIIENENALKVEKDAHPDVKIFPTKDKLLVADSGKITEEAFIRPVFADKKIFIIRNISNSMESAQNKLLKILEEPPKNVYFIITCSNENLVLPTIKSRCTKHELGKLSKEQIESVLKKNENSHLVSALCDGYLGKAIELERKINLKEYFESVLSLFTRLKSSRELLTYSNNVFSFKENIDQTLLIMSFIIEDMLTIKSGEKIRFVDYKNQIEMASEEFSYNALIETAKIIDRASEELFYNANPVVVFENMLLNILEVKFLCK